MLRRKVAKKKVAKKKVAKKKVAKKKVAKKKVAKKKVAKKKVAKKKVAKKKVAKKKVASGVSQSRKVRLSRIAEVVRSKLLARKEAAERRIKNNYRSATSFLIIMLVIAWRSVELFI